MRWLKEKASLKIIPEFLDLITKWNFGADDHVRKYRRRERPMSCQVWEGLMKTSA